VDRAYDFSPLDAPMTAAESAVRRRVLLAGRSPISELGLLRGLLLLGMVVIAWPALLMIVGVFAWSTIAWVVANGPTADWGFGTPILLLTTLVAVAAVVLVTRLLIIPPAWGRWVRMQRFAEQNGMTFLRRSSGVGAPAAGLGAALLSDVFTDPATGIVLGNAGAGTGAQAFILIGPGEARVAPIDAQLLTGFTVREQPEGRLATRYRSVPMRDSVTVRRMFATADAVQRGAFADVA
jgi:hypothetical protein